MGLFGDQYDGIGGTYVVDPETGERRPAEDQSFTQPEAVGPSSDGIDETAADPGQT